MLGAWPTSIAWVDLEGDWASPGSWDGKGDVGTAGEGSPERGLMRFRQSRSRAGDHVTGRMRRPLRCRLEGGRAWAAGRGGEARTPHS